jgi:Arc/MetJ-type ribon-helix-helix transcriptional regulator
MTIELNTKYQDILRNMIELGIADSMEEAVKQAIVIYQTKLEAEEYYLVEKAVNKEIEDINSGKIALFNAEDVFSEAGL